MAPEIDPPPDPLGALLGYHLRRVSVLVMADLTQSLAPLCLKPADASILFAVAAGDGLTQSDLGRILGIQRANMAPLIAALVQRGLVERKPVNGRSHALRLSSAGRAAQQEAWRLTMDHEDRLFGTIDAGVKAEAILGLKQLWRRAAEEGSGSFLKKRSKKLLVF